MKYCVVKFADGRYLTCRLGRRGIEWAKTSDITEAYVQSGVFLQQNFSADEPFEIVEV